MKTLKRIFAALVVVIAAVLAVSCGGKDDPQEEVKNVGIEIQTKPTKTAYFEGETFDATGMVVVVVNNKEEKTTVTDYTVDKTVLALGDTKVTVTYATFTADVAITVAGPSSVASVYTLANNAPVYIEGTVYETKSNGFFMYDATGTIYVSYSKVTEEGIAAGAKVKVAGKFGTSPQPQIKGVTSVTKVATDQAILEAVEASLTEITGADHGNAANFGRKVQLVATVNADAAENVYLTDVDGNQLDFDEESDLTAVKALVGHRVTITVVVSTYNGGLWAVLFGAHETVVDNPISAEEVLAIVAEDVSVPEVIYGALSLPTAHKNLTALTYAWESNSEYIVISETGVEVVTDEADHDVTLTLTATMGEVTVNKTYEIKSKAIVETALKDLLANAPEVNGSKVITSGLIVSKTRNQGGSIFGWVMQDPTSLQTIFVQYSDKETAEYSAVKVGDMVRLTGCWDFAYTDHPLRINKVSKLEVLTSDNAINYNKEAAIKLETKEDYEAFNNAFINHEYDNVLVKIVNPTFGYVTSSIGPWINISYETVTYQGFSPAPAPNYIYAFQVNALKLTLGADGTAWWDFLKTIYTEPVFRVEGMTIYAYLCLYGPSYAQFVIPSEDMIEYPAELAPQAALQKVLPTAIDAGETIALPAEYDGHAITWVCEDANIDVATGLVAMVENAVISTLKATVEGVGEYTFHVAITPVVPVEIAEIKTLPADSTVYMRGVVIGMSTANQATAAIELLVKDEDSNEIIGVSGLGSLFGSHMQKIEEATGLSSKQTLTYGPLAYGDLIQIPVKVQAAANSYQDVNKVRVAFNGPDFSVKPMDSYVVAHNVSTAINKEDANIINVTSQEELKNVVLVENEGTYAYADNVYKIVHLSGTIKAVAYNGSSTASKQSPYLRFFFEATALAEQRFASAKTVSPCFMTAFNNMSLQTMNMGDIFVAEGETNWSTSYTAPHAFSGEIYAVYVGGQSSSNYGCFIIIGDDCVIPAASAQAE